VFQYAFPLRKTDQKSVTSDTHTHIGRTLIFKALLHNSPFGAIIKPYVTRLIVISRNSKKTKEFLASIRSGSASFIVTRQAAGAKGLRIDRFTDIFRTPHPTH
jgi:hypothetical protein